MSQEENTILLPNKCEVFGHYIFLKRLAAGGMAEVFLARPASLDGNGRVLVVKRILPHVADNSIFLNMFHAEIQVILGFNHPHTVQLHDFGMVNKQPYIAMEYIEGKSLKQVLNKLHNKKMKMQVPMALSLLSQAAAGLSYAHTFVNKVTGEVVNAIHRDISPQNLMVTYEGNLKVIDFGIAKAASGAQEATQVGTIKGKMAYLSPEQITSKNVDARADIFALGIVAWELLTMQRAFLRDGESEFHIMSRIDNCEKHLQPPSAINKDVPPELDQIIMKALKKNPDDRYPTAKAFQAALRKFMVEHYPDYSYSDTGATITSLFETEIEVERKSVRELNVQAHNELIERLESPTLIPNIDFKDDKTSPGMDYVDNRLKTIEAMMKQKASGRHYMMLAFYILAVFALQIEGRYSLVNMIIPVEDEASIEAKVESREAQKKQARNATVNKKRKVASSPQASKVVRKNINSAKVAEKAPVNPNSTKR